MPLFICDCCGAVDNTTCGGNFWFKNAGDNTDEIPDLCCKCYTGEWHNKFPYEVCTRDVFLEIGESNFVYWLVNNEPKPDTNQPAAPVPKEPYTPKAGPRSKNHLKKLAMGIGKKKRRNR